MLRDIFIAYQKRNCFISGLKPNVFREEIYYRILNDVIREAVRNYPRTGIYCDYLIEFKRLNPRKKFQKIGRIFILAASNFQRGEC